MKAPALALTALVAVVCSLAVTFLVSPPAPEQEPDAELLARIAELEQQLELMRGLQATEQPSGQPEPASYEPATRTDNMEDLVAREVQRYFNENPGVGTPAGEGLVAEAGELSAEEKQQLLDESIRLFLDPETDWGDAEDTWTALHAAGLMHEAIALLEAEVARAPNNVALKVQLGNAYLQPIMQGEAAGPQAGTWSMKADKMYDEALAMDDQNWDARFAKAVSLSFWPPIFGKQNEAIKNFEILVDQQESRATSSEYVETYVLLGNLYQQNGQPEKAAELWNRGLNLYPGNANLRSSLGLE